MKNTIGRILEGLALMLLCICNGDGIQLQAANRTSTTAYEDSMRSEDIISLSELRSHLSTLQLYAYLSPKKRVWTRELNVIRDKVYDAIAVFEQEQLNGNLEQISEVYQYIDIWEQCLSIFHDNLGKKNVDSILIDIANRELKEWAAINAVINYSVKMRRIEPYWNSLNLFSAELYRIKFMIRDGRITEARRHVDKVINSLGSHDLLPVHPGLITSGNVQAINYVIDTNGVAEALKLLHKWYGKPGDYFSNNSSKIASGLMYHAAKLMMASGFVLEAKDYFERLYTFGAIERDLHGIDPYDEICENLFSLSSLHYEDTRSQLADIEEQHNTLFAQSPVAIDLFNTSVENYKNMYTYIKDRMTLSRIKGIEKEKALNMLKNAEKELDHLDPLGMQSNLEMDMRPMLYTEIGNVYNNEKDYKKAIEYYQIALSFGNYEPAAVNLGVAYCFGEDYQNAIKYLEVGRSYFGTDPTGMLMLAYAATGDYNKAKIVGRECFNEKRERDLELIFKMLDYERRYYAFGDAYMPIYVQYPEVFGELCFDSCLYTKSIVLHSERTIRRAILSGNTNDNPYSELSKGFNNNRDVQTLEREYYETINQKIRHKGRLDEYYVNWQDVQGCLKSGEIAIEFFNYYDLGDPNEKYAAVVLADKGKPRLIKLTSGDKINAFLLGKDKGYGSIDKSANIFNTLFGQITPYMTEGKTVYFSAAGLLHQLNIECLYTTKDKNAKMACQVFNLNRVSSMRELCIRKNNDIKYESALLYGGLQYDLSRAELESLHKTYSSREEEIEGFRIVVRGGGSMAMDLIAPLQNTEKEVETISRLLGEHNVSIFKYIGSQGVEESFKSFSGHSPNVIHFATHGFYSTELSSTKEAYYDSFTPNTLDRSGIILSGAKKALSGEIVEGVEDGVLLASELAAMDLSNTDIVVLSACETGLGDIKGGDVYGLQRGLKLSGVQTIIMSLWNVDDESTMEFMISFYDHLLSGLSKRESFDLSRLLLFNKYPDRSDIWAGFIMLD